MPIRMAWASELPAELLCRPMGLVVLTGLDITYNAIHKTIWDSFCNNRRPDRVPLQFVVLGADHEYPRCRSKRSSYEWYIPKGILKTGWMRKHLEQIPSVVVLFFDLDWDDNMWKERQMECATKVEIVRNSLQGRNTRVAVVLIQKNAPLPPGEDIVAAERAASLCSACELSAKSLFVLPHTDHLYGYTIRLENAFYELSQSFYHAQARRVKAHKDFINKTTHQFLFVRHQFKIAFFNELKQDTHTALKHYKAAMAHVLDLRMHDTNLLEVKTIAGFINYKICRLSFQHNAPLDAIAQFRKHIDFFKGKVGIPELAFEHSAWMSKQFQVFGELFDEAIKLGLTAIQTQHPGFYYQQAGNHAATRKNICTGMTKPSGPAPSPDPLENLLNLDYYGQRPWRQGHQSIEAPDALKEREGIEALQGLEVDVDHSWIIIPLLSSAVAQFKKYKSPRMKRYLMVQMGEEYYHAKDYTKALTLLTRVAWDYRNERWWLLLTSIHVTGLRCAYLTANIQEYVTICLEMMGTYIQCSEEEKTRIQTNLLRVMANNPPEPEPGCNASCIEVAKQLWQAEPEQPCLFTVEMQNFVPFVECKTSFTQDSFTTDALVVVKVFLRSSCQFPIRFSKLSVLLNNQIYNQHCELTDGERAQEAGDLYLVPGKVKVHTFSFLPQGEDVGKSVEVTSVAMELGNDNSKCALLKWSGGGGDAGAPPLSQVQHETTVWSVHDDIDWDELRPRSSTKVNARSSQVDIKMEHQAPSLVNEFYLVNVTVENNEKETIQGAKLSFGLKEGQDNMFEQSTHVSVDNPGFETPLVPRRNDVELGSLKSGEQLCKQFYLKSLKPGDRVIHAMISYDIDVTLDKKVIQCKSSKDTSVTLNTLDPFTMSIKLVSNQFEALDAVHAEEPFLVLVELTCVSPWELEIHGSSFELTPYASEVDETWESHLAGISLKNNASASECCCLMAPTAVQPNVPLGHYELKWKRHSENSTIASVISSFSLPKIAIEHIPLFVDVDLPAHGQVRKKMEVVYSIYNRTPYSQEIEVTMEHSEVFMFAGHKQVHMRLLPNNKHQVVYFLFPILPGNVQLPKLHVNMTRYPGTMDSIIQKMLPTHIYVMPKGTNDLQ